MSDFFSSLINGFGSSLTDLANQQTANGGGQTAVTQGNATSTDNTLVDPSTLAANVISGGQPAATPTQGQNQGQNQQQNQQNQQNQNPIAALTKALAKNAQRRPNQNPWMTGGQPQNQQVQPGANPITGQPAPPSVAANLPSPDAAAMEFSNDNPPPTENISFPDAVGAGLRTNAPDTNFQVPGQPANQNAAPQNFGDYLQMLRQGMSGPDASQGVQGLTPEVQSPDPGGGLLPGGGSGGPPSGSINLSGLAGLARMFGFTGPEALPIGLGIAMKPTPAETGELPPYKGPSPQDYPQSTTYPQAQPGQPQQPPAPSDPPAKKATAPAPKTGKPVKHVDPKTNKPVDPQTGDPIPAKKEWEYQPKTGEARNKEPRNLNAVQQDQQQQQVQPQPWQQGDGHGPIIRDASGVSHGVPAQLGQLARQAAPLIALALMGGFGGRHGHGGGHRGFGGYHPGFGGGGRPHGWERREPGAFRYYQRPQPTPLEDALIAQSFGAAMPQQNQQRQQGQPEQYGPGNHFGDASGQQGSPQQNQQQQQGNPWQTSGPQAAGTPLADNIATGSADNVLATIRQRESGGNNTAPYFDTSSGQWHSASGYYQFKPETWKIVAQQSGDGEAAQYPQAYLAPQAVQDRMARFALQKYGPNADFTWAASGKNLGKPYANVDPSSWGASSGPGRTQTGGSTAPNPQGNIAYQ